MPGAQNALRPAKRVAYLFGAGATHGELFAFSEALAEKGHGLLISHVSERIIAKARAKELYVNGLELVSGTSGSLNIELLISLIENSKIHDWEYKTQYLKKLVQRDIEAILKPERVRSFYLHKAIFEFHRRKKVRAEEMLIGLISLNYDDVLDRAYREFYGMPNYCCTLADDAISQKIPLLKLHGSFNWSPLQVRGRSRNIEIIPLGSNKNYLHPPYSFIWNRAMEILIECDTLRVIGCSLSQNDVHLIDLLFKAQLERRTAFEIEIISGDPAGEGIKNNYGFFRGIRTLTEIEKGIVPESDPRNPFKTWLKYKSAALLRGEVSRTKYLEKVQIDDGHNS